MSQLYGKTPSEKEAEENLQCREIAKEISQFGVTERQRIFLIYLLALEIEDSEKLALLCNFLKELAPEVFISSAQ